MSASASTPVYVLKWKMGPKERGRQHMAVFIPGPSHRDADQSTEEHLGTLFQVKGSPLAGFTHEIRKNWNRQNDTGVESVHLLCQAESQHAPGDSMANGEIIQTALIVRPPGVTQPLWDAESIFDCQDWVYDFVTRLSQRGIVDAAVLDTLRRLQDKKTPLMRQPGFEITTPLFTASMARTVQPVANERTQRPVPASRARCTNSEWDTERKGFKRYDQIARKWEFRGADGVWSPSE